MNKFDNLVCLKCGEAGTLCLQLNTMADVYCTQCGHGVDLQDFRAIVEDWSRFFKWLDEQQPKPSGEMR